MSVDSVRNSIFGVIEAIVLLCGLIALALFIVFLVLLLSKKKQSRQHIAPPPIPGPAPAYPMPKTCAKCGAVNAPESTFCKNCSAPL